MPIAGYRPATHGAVLVNGVNIYQHFDAIRDQIGFVPQKDIIHVELSVYQELDFAARLRMPADTTPAERHMRIMEVLDKPRSDSPQGCTDQRAERWAAEARFDWRRATHQAPACSSSTSPRLAWTPALRLP